MPYTADDLAAVLDRLPQGKRDTAFDLVQKAKKWTPSPAQARYIDGLTKEAKGENARPTTQVGDLTAAIALFDKARQKLKYPKVVIQAGDDVIIKLSVAGDNSKNPGSINVTSRDGDWNSRLYYGRIGKDGTFYPGRNADRIPTLVEYLKAFAKEPATVAAAYGHLTGHCCFCLRKLDDARSTAVGYGPTCAKNFGLPWGNEKHSFELPTETEEPEDNEQEPETSWGARI